MGVSENIKIVYLDQDENFVFRDDVLENYGIAQEETTQRQQAPRHSSAQKKNVLGSLANSKSRIRSPALSAQE